MRQNTYSSRSKVVKISTRVGGCWLADVSWRVASMPSSSGIRMSMSTTSGCDWRARDTASGHRWLHRLPQCRPQTPGSSESRCAQALVVGDHDPDGHARTPVRRREDDDQASPVPGNDSTSIVPSQSATRSRIAIVGQSSRRVREAVTAAYVVRAEPKEDIDRSQRAGDRAEASQETVDGQVDAGRQRAWLSLDVQRHVRLSPSHLLDQWGDLPDAGLRDQFGMVVRMPQDTRIRRISPSAAAGRRSFPSRRQPDPNPGPAADWAA